MKVPYMRDGPFLAGETVTAGEYECTRCRASHTVPDGSVTNLPVCPACQGQQWRPAGRGGLLGSRGA